GDAGQLHLIVGSLLSCRLAFIWLAAGSGGGKKRKKGGDPYTEQAERDVEHIFNETFREELRNRGRLHFEKILGENAMFLQQDLRLTTSQLNEYMKAEINRELKDAFVNYQGAISDAKQLAIESIEKTKVAIDEERRALIGELEKEVTEEKERRI